MALNVGDILKVVHKQLLFAQVVLNVYFYVVDTVAGIVNETAFANDWVADYMPLVNATQTVALTNTSVRVDNITGGFSFAEIDVTGTGGVKVGTAAPSFNAVGYKLTMVTTLLRPGGKRIAGLIEDDIAGNSLVIPTPIEMETLADAMSADLIVGVIPNTATLSPVIIKRPFIPGSPPFITQPVQEALLNVQISSQVSRKAGQGA